MRILVYNWRDIENPSAGGAEVFTQEVFKRLVDRGHNVTLFTSRFEGAPAEEVIDGIEIIRSGGRLRVYRQARIYYQKRFQGKFDVVVDEINTRPFLTPKFVKNTPIVALIHQLAREYWLYETRWPLSWVGYYWLEDRWLSNYTGVPTITVSQSTKQDLQELGFEDVVISSPGLDVEPLDSVPEKDDVPTFLYVGRMKKAKRPKHALEAMRNIKRELPSAKLHMVGDGYLMDELTNQPHRDVKFHGYVSDEKKFELMKRSHVLLVPGVREGWGLVVIEANAMGTPAVGYDVPGLRDSIQDGETGYLCPPRVETLSEYGVSMYENGLEHFANRARRKAEQYSWDRTTDRIEAELDRVSK